MRISRLVIIAVSYGLVLTTVTTSAQGSSTYQPQTRAGLMAAAKMYVPQAVTRTKNCITIYSDSGTIKRGIAEVGFSEIIRGNCASGARQIWAYTGTQWKPLSVFMQNEPYYTLKIPGKISICKGNEYTLIRSGPSLTAKVVGKVTANTSAYTTQVILTQQSSDSWTVNVPRRDGLAWYQITWRGKKAWVGSSRTMAPEFGCKYWTGGRVLGY